MQGGPGNDLFVVDDVGDVVVESAQAGTDTVESSVTFTLEPRIENLTLTGSAGIDATGNAAGNTLIGNAAANTLDGKAGADTLRGGQGDDRYAVDEAGDVVEEASGEGTDTIESATSYTLPAAVEQLTLTGTADLDGTGNSADNTLVGNEGDNRLDGGQGANALIGGGGDDIFVDPDGDTIQDLGPGDSIVLSGEAGLQGDAVRVQGDEIQVDLDQDGDFTGANDIAVALGSGFGDFLQVRDDGGDAEIGVVANEPPQISFQVAENVQTAGQFVATDPNAGDTATFSLTGGPDRDAFDVDATSGALSFQTAPDFEDPADANGDNVYKVEVTVTDKNGASTTADVSASVTDVSEGGGPTGGGTPGDETDVTETTTIGPDGEGQETTNVNPGNQPTEFNVGGEDGGPPDFTFGLPAGVGGRVEGKTQKQSGQQAQDDLLSRIGANSDDPEETEELQQKAQEFLDGLPEGSEVTISSFTPSVDGDQAPEDPIEINGNDDPNSIESMVIDTRNLPSGTRINLNGVDNVTFIGDVEASGGEGNQTANGDGGSQFMVLGAGDDILSAGGGADTVGSEGGDDVVYGNAGTDYAFGGEGADQVYGNQDADEVYGNQGDDLVFGGQDADLVFGGQDSDQVYGNLADDQVYGNKGSDDLFGGQDDDDLFGGQDGDRIYGNLGDDRIYGNVGDDTLYGGEGADEFAFLSGDGQDTVADFTDGDTIALQADINGTGIGSFDDLEITENENGDAVIDLGDDNSLTIQGVSPGELSESDFSFF